MRPPLSPEQKAREVAMIKSVDRWPCYPRLHVKKMSPTGYSDFGFVTARGSTPIAAVQSKMQFSPARIERFESFEAMVDAGWIVD